jgi:hypothetical protein
MLPCSNPSNTPGVARHEDEERDLTPYSGTCLHWRRRYDLVFPRATLTIYKEKLLVPERKRGTIIFVCVRACVRPSSVPRVFFANSG